MKRIWQFVKRTLGRLAGLPGISGMIAVMGRLAEAGTAGYPIDIKRRLMILNMFSYLIIFTTVIFALQYGLTEGVEYRPLVYINLAIAAIVSLVPLMHRINEIAGGLLIVITEYVAITNIASYLGRDGGGHLLFIIGAAVPFFVFGLERLRLALAVVLGGMVLHLYIWFSFPPSTALIPPNPRILNDLYTQSAITTFGFIAVTVWYAFRLVENAKAETDTLLRNILPDQIVARLKTGPERLIADSFDSASILFSDISGFVPLARSLGAAQVVELLNTIVREFDAIAARHGVEKIKTIGDAYMAAAGIPDPAPDHTARVAFMGLDMLAFMERLRQDTGLDVSIRIGIASGPVMAGVIGMQKFSYDVWGDTVNLASRLESHSVPGRILICPACRTLLEHEFTFETRGEIEIKGVGLKETFYVTGVKDASRENPGIDAP
ncbi:MAG: adenylate/guanylate cyclase domain-containing protein [Hyphomicrobiaceae bacterium]|nr:adenylate/guanylate cyclase domain-containing protein [Hyphomicrobiaceae bacterium]MCC0006744.1 adenylate/guanylate cyclase domain-containing protein [Hyphomicrobiaceae bacterium]